MDSICRAYVSQVKALLPVSGKSERFFVKKLHSDLCNYCEDNKITTIDELYKNYGTPQEIAFDYIALMKPKEISKRINTAKSIKILVVGLLALAFIATTIFGIFIVTEYQSLKEQEAIAVEYTISD